MLFWLFLAAVIGNTHIHRFTKIDSQYIDSVPRSVKLIADHELGSQEIFFGSQKYFQLEGISGGQYEIRISYSARFYCNLRTNILIKDDIFYLNLDASNEGVYIGPDIPDSMQFNIVLERVYFGVQKSVFGVIAFCICWSVFSFWILLPRMTSAVEHKLNKISF